MTNDGFPQVADPGDWTCTTYRSNGTSFKVIAFRGEGRSRVAVHRDRLTPEEVVKFNPDLEWTGRKPTSKLVDLVAVI
jgi:hypothetical protein